MTDDQQDAIRVPDFRVGAAPTIRVANKAIIIRDDHLLVTVNGNDLYDTFYLCPGGGQDHGEDAHAGLKRECREEIGCDVIVGELAFLRDYIGADHEFAEHDGWAHQREAFFFCELAPGAEPRLTEEGDSWQTGFTWLPLAELATTRIFPKALVTWLSIPAPERPRYLGNVN